MSEPRNWPLDSVGTRNACVMTVTIMTLMLTSAKPLALASCDKLASLLHGALWSICLCDIFVQRQRVRDA